MTKRGTDKNGYAVHQRLQPSSHTRIAGLRKKSPFEETLQSLKIVSVRKCRGVLDKRRFLPG